MKKYRVKINMVDCGVYEAPDLVAAEKMALYHWRHSIVGHHSLFSVVITRED